MKFDEFLYLASSAAGIISERSTQPQEQSAGRASAGAGQRGKKAAREQSKPAREHCID